MERCHLENFLLMWCQRAFRDGQGCAEARERMAEFPPFCMEDVDHDALTR